jgi:hypothetical protein
MTGWHAGKRMQFRVDYIIGTRESSFWKRQASDARLSHFPLRRTLGLRENSTPAMIPLTVSPNIGRGTAMDEPLHRTGTIQSGDVAIFYRAFGPAVRVARRPLSSCMEATTLIPTTGLRLPRDWLRTAKSSFLITVALGTRGGANIRIIRWMRFFPTL